MPARMWRHGIHSFLELLRDRLLDSLDHMLSFMYLAYSMMALLMESVPSFEETWIECLVDLARYRMAIEESDLRDREVWAGVARMWYDKAADKAPNVGRIQHHLAVLARPNIVQQLFYYSKAWISINAFPNAKESVILLFSPFLANGEIASQRYPLVESAFMKAAAIQFTRGPIGMYNQPVAQFLSVLNSHIGRVTAKFRGQGPEMASILCATLFDFSRRLSLESILGI
jgi:Est1 DNA/RNA binding domain